MAPLHRESSAGVVSVKNCSGPTSDYVAEKGYSLKIATIPNREGVSLRNRLLEVFQDTPIYFPSSCKLEVQLSIQNRELVKYIDGSVGRYEITCTANYSVVSIRTGKTIFKDKVCSAVTYNTASSQSLFEFSVYAPYYDSMFEQIAREIYESVRVCSIKHHED